MQMYDAQDKEGRVLMEKDKHKWLRYIKALLSSNTKNIAICWVPSHCQVFGNEKADEWSLFDVVN